MLNWVDIDFEGSLEDFAARNLLDPTLMRVVKEVLLLPSSTDLREKTFTTNVFPSSVKEVLAAFADHGIEADLYGERGNRRELVRKSADVLLPMLLFAGNAAVAVGLGILGNWIYDRWVKGGGAVPSVRAEYAQLTVDGRIMHWRRIEGPADQIYTVLLQTGPTDPIVQARPVTGTNRDDDWWQTHCRSKAQAALAVASELLAEGEHHIRDGNNDLAERLLRRALVKLREAVLWEPHRVEHRRHLHALGGRVHDEFGCQLEYRDGSYWVNCPVTLSHSRSGFSIGGSGRTVCSICEEEILSCPHVKGRVYDRVVACRIGELCSICGERQCGHVEGSMYDHVRAFGVMVEIDLDHVSFVENPANPLAVVHSYSLIRSDLASMLPEEELANFEYGQTAIHCHHCKLCDGTT